MLLMPFPSHDGLLIEMKIDNVPAMEREIKALLTIPKTGHPLIAPMRPFGSNITQVRCTQKVCDLRFCHADAYIIHCAPRNHTTAEEQRGEDEE